MNDEFVVYDNRTIQKEGFRAFIYSTNNISKLVNSWEEFERHMESGVWFTNKEDIEAIKNIEVKESVSDESVIEQKYDSRKSRRTKSKLVDENGVEYL